MVGGLVEDDQVRLLQQKFAECNAGFLTTGERGNRFLKLVLGKAKAFKTPVSSLL